MKNETVRLYDDTAIDQIESESLAIEQSFFSRTPKNRSLRYCAELMEMNAGHLTRVIQGLAGMPTNRAAAFCRTMGNAIWLQKVARTLGFVLVPEDKYQQMLIEQERGRGSEPLINWNVKGFSIPR